MSLKWKIILILTFLLINSVFVSARLVTHWEINNWLLKLPDEEISLGASISLHPLYITRNIEGNIRLNDIYIYDTRDTQARRLIFDKVSANINHNDFFLDLGHLDIQYSPYTIGRTEKEELLLGNPQIRGISFRDYELAKGKVSGFLGWPENANAVFGCKLDLPVEEGRIVFVYANDLKGSIGNRLEAPIINEQIFTAELNRDFGLLNNLTAIFGSYRSYAVSSNEQLFYNLKLSSKVIENNLVELGYWNMDPNFDFKYRDRQSADPFIRRDVGNKVDQLIGKRGFFIKTESENSLLRQLELVFYETKSDEKNKVRDIYLLLGKSFPNKMTLLVDFNAQEKWSKNHYDLNEKQIQRYTFVGVEKSLALGGGNFKTSYEKGFNLGGTSISDYRLIAEAQIELNRTQKNIIAKYEQLLIMGAQRKSFSLSYQLSPNLYFIINQKQQSGFGEGRDQTGQLPIKLINEGLLNNYTYVGLQGCF